MFTLTKTKITQMPGYVKGRTPKRTSVIVCRSGGVDETRLEKLKDVAKKVVADKRKGCTKAISAIKEIIESEREVYNTLMDELKALAQEDIKRVRDHIASSDLERKEAEEVVTDDEEDVVVTTPEETKL